ncbi:MAG: endonuclease/exonuclease/phosphatase family protein [Prolixibacteraceae bacterium]|jgi:hypothetical protein|nr:endonuclease/exonuclease/phosphatase family protein [Prolixibacteraceae bacterium]
MHAGTTLRVWLFLLIVTFPGEIFGQNKSTKDYKIVFYNTENLFDPFDDPATNDGEYTPDGKCHWTFSRLNQKIMMVYRAIISASNGAFPDIIGLAEVENLWILEYLLRKSPLTEANYGIVHKESPDPRGIDVALLYRKGYVVPIDFQFIPVRGIGSSKFSSRDILYFKARFKDEVIHFFVNHWPSRSGGYMETLGKRNIAAGIVRKMVDSMLVINPQGKLLLMGDFNATPDEDCFTKILRANNQAQSAVGNTLFNLSKKWMSEGIGTIRTRGLWEIFDQFICSYNLLNSSGLHIDQQEASICTEAFLMEEDKRYLGKKPFRTYLGPVYHGGVSDHLPISLVIRGGSE